MPVERKPIEITDHLPAFAPVILAGGSGTRFWPRSRRDRAKQVLALDGERTMIQQTVDRLLPLAAIEDFWVITNELLHGTITAQLPQVPAQHILSEPAGRNTAPAAGLAAFLLERESPNTVLGIFPADAVVRNAARFEHVIREGIRIAAAGENIVVLGVPATRPETGYGYIETGDAAQPGGVESYRVRHFTEKPELDRAEAFLTAGNYSWNSGIFLWSARTLANAIREHRPDMAPLLERIAAAYGPQGAGAVHGRAGAEDGGADFERVFAEAYPQCENISIDYAVLEPRSAKGQAASSIYCLPAEFGWNDLGSWAALHEHKLSAPGLTHEHANVLDAAGSVVMEACGNYVFAPGKTVALVGVRDLVVVETDDAILVTTRDRSQDVGKIVKALKDTGRAELT